MALDPLIQLAAEGDMTAFEGVYRTHYRRVYNKCLRLTRNAVEAEDLTQDVLFSSIVSSRLFAVNLLLQPGCIG